jgi:hypothetical protein
MFTKKKEELFLELSILKNKLPKNTFLLLNPLAEYRTFVC